MDEWQPLLAQTITPPSGEAWPWVAAHAVGALLVVQRCLREMGEVP